MSLPLLQHLGCKGVLDSVERLSCELRDLRAAHAHCGDRDKHYVEMLQKYESLRAQEDKFHEADSKIKMLADRAVLLDDQQKYFADMFVRAKQNEAMLEVRCSFCGGGVGMRVPNGARVESYTFVVECDTRIRKQTFYTRKNASSHRTKNNNRTRVGSSAAPRRPTRTCRATFPSFRRRTTSATRRSRRCATN